MNVPILYEDDDVVVVNKPSGVVVNRADTVKELTIQDWFAETYLAGGVPGADSWSSLVPTDFAAEYGTPEEIFAERGGVVHRLDKETSGVLLLAKNPGALVALLAQFRERETHKKYLCLVHGKFQILQDTLRLPLGRSTQNRTKFTIDASGRVAETAYQVQKTFAGVDAEKVLAQYASPSDAPKQLRKKLQTSYQGFSLVECWPKTGRTHQIRVHMAAVQHPIVADETYLGSKRQTLDETWCSRLFLHAAELQFTHPRTQKMLTCAAPLPAELGKALGFLVEAT